MKTYVLARETVRGLEYVRAIVGGFQNQPVIETTMNCDAEAMHFVTLDEVKAVAALVALGNERVGSRDRYEVYCHVNEVTRVEE